MMKFILNGIIWILFYYITRFINVCIHELGHGIAGKLLGFDFRIEIGEGKKLFKITSHFIVFSEIILAYNGYTHFYSDDDKKVYSKLSYLKKIVYASGGIIAQLIFIILLSVLLYNKIAVNYLLVELFYKFMLLTSIILLIGILIPSTKYKTDGYWIYKLFMTELENRRNKKIT